ncbi:hypothetical protein ACK3TF_006201 [Chlorella vulgaris]
MGAASSTHKAPKAPQKKQVCIIGGGVAGMACAWSLSRYPERFYVEVVESLPETGGVASTCAVSTGEEINDQEFGFEPHPVQFRIAFGRGEAAWTNHSDSALVRRLQPDIARFGRLLRWVHRLEPLFIFIPIDQLLRLLRFSEAFRTEMVLPLVALFFGTGNQTPHVSAAVIARVFQDPQLRLFEYSPQRLLDQVPTMFAFPRLGEVFAAIAEALPSVRTGVRVEGVQRSAGGVTYDEVVFACGAEEARRMLGSGASRLEAALLPRVTYFNDLIVTHRDEAYMERHYEFVPQQRDMYFVRTDPKDKQRIEMSFNLTMYQPHLQGSPPIYQSIFLDDSHSSGWTVGAIDKAKVLKTRMTRQFAHTWKHFATWVPFVQFLQGRRHTWFAGGYTLFNTHEIATMSGLAVADRLGAPYPFAHDKLAEQQFDSFMKVAHGPFVRRAPAVPQKGQGQGPPATVAAKKAA